MAVGVSVPDAMGWSTEGGVRKPLGALPLADGCRERKLEELALGERAFGVEEEAAVEGRCDVKVTGEPVVGEEGMDSLERDRVK